MIGDHAPSQSEAGHERFILVLEYDLSLTTGYSINERESAVALLDQFPDRVRVVCPRPAHPDVFFDPRIDYVRDHSRHHPVKYPRFLLALRRRLRELIYSYRPAAIVFRAGPLPLMPAWTLRGGTPVILKQLAGYPLFGREHRRWPWRVLAVAAAPLYRYIAAGCLGADIESYAYAEWLPSMFPVARSNLTLVPNGANVDSFAPTDALVCRKKFGWDGFRHIVGYVGAIDSLRCAEMAVAAALRLRDIPGLAMVLVGNGPLVQPIKEQIKHHGLQDRVILAGSLPYSDIPSVINAFDVALDLSKVPVRVRDKILFGSFSQKIAQYLACGVPVVAWRTSDTSFLDQAGVGRTVPIGDVAALETTIRELLVAKASTPQLSSTIRAFACEELASEVIARRRMAFWNQLVGSSRYEALAGSTSGLSLK